MVFPTCVKLLDKQGEGVSDIILGLFSAYKPHKTDIVELDELYVGDVIQATINNRMHVDSVLFQYGNCRVIGTPEDLMKALDANTQCK